MPKHVEETFTIQVEELRNIADVLIDSANIVELTLETAKNWRAVESFSSIVIKHLRTANKVRRQQLKGMLAHLPMQGSLA